MGLKQRLDKVQNKAKRKILNHYNKGFKRCHIQMPTGTGKTNLGFKVIKSLKSNKTLWLTQTEELIDQTIIRLKKSFPKKSVGLIKQDTFEAHSDIVVASVQSLTKDRNLLSLDEDFFDLIIVDEAHHGWASTWMKIIERFEGLLLGLTATPYRMDGLSLDVLYGELVFELSFEEAQKQKLIAEDISKIIITSSQLDGVRIKGKDFSKSALEKLVVSEARNEAIVKSYKKYGHQLMRDNKLKYKTICFCITIEHALRMKDHFLENNIKAEILCSDQKHQSAQERKEVWDTFQTSHDIEVLCVVDILNEGKDIPDVSCVLLARPTASAIIYPQQLGRGARFIERLKSKFVVLDYVDNVSKSFYQQNIAKFKGKKIAKKDIVLEYYNGEDPIISVDDLCESLYTNLNSFQKRQVWDKAKVTEALRGWIEAYGDIKTNELTLKNDLPGRKVVEGYFGSFNDMRVFFDLPVKTTSKFVNNDKKQISKVLKDFHEKNGRLLQIHLGSKNNLPSIKKIKSVFGSWPNCKEELGIINYNWTKVSTITHTIQFLKMNNTKILKQAYFTSTRRLEKVKLPPNGLPSVHLIRKLFGSWDNFFESVDKKYPVKNPSTVAMSKRKKNTIKDRKQYILDRYPIDKPIKEETLLAVYAGNFNKKYGFARKELKKLVAQRFLSKDSKGYYSIQ